MENGAPHLKLRLNLPQFDRLRRYRELLQEAPRTLDVLACDAGVDARTVDRDLKFAYKEWGWQVGYNPRTRRREARGALSIPLLSLDEEEALALLVAEPALRAYGAGPFARPLHSALQKIKSSLDVPLPPEQPPVGFELHPLRQTDPRLFQQFARATRQHERLRLTYYNPEKEETTSRLVDLYLLCNYGGGWYVVAYCHLRKDLRDFAISEHRVRALVNTGVTFQPNPSLDLQGHLKKGFGIFKSGNVCEIVLRFSPKQAIYQAERVPQPGEVQEPQPDGSLLVRFTAPVNIGLTRWVLQYGSEIEVLEPAELREIIYKEALAVVERMRKK